MRQLIPACLVLTGVALMTASASAQRLEIPRRHDRPPGPPVSAEEAVARMVVPEGFSVEIVATEPDVVNPVSMFIDEQGRFWITESLEYPRKDPGPGRDRVKVLEDTDGDGKVDKTTIFADGLNIPSGIAVGHGGVWVANSPDILFLQDTDGDLVADKKEVVVTGFGRTDTHELPNSFTWGPDGWLYGLNGVFNFSHVKYGETNPNYDPNHPGWEFTCAMWRIHPRTREFQVFAEGTSNPWGIAINDTGDFFISACVIDHLWHIVESAYYVRQGGPYPAHTWPMESIVDFTHQKAAYCGITWYDSDAYPEEYRHVLYMGNIHGGCINADVLERNGSSYRGAPHPGFPAPEGAFEGDEYHTVAKIGEGDDARLADFLTANDPWFMPVVQKTGPDGCLYILDWYDRYHCYQDANADPAGIEREKGRLYRVRYQDAPHVQPTDYAERPERELVAHLNAPNTYVRETAQRLLQEGHSTKTGKRLREIVTGDGPPIERLRAFWVLIGSDTVDGETLQAALADSNPAIRSWAVRAVGDSGTNDEPLLSRLKSMTRDDSPTVQLQVVIAARKLAALDPLPILVDTLAHSGEDTVILQVVWQNLHPLLKDHSEQFLTLVQNYDLQASPNLARILPRVTERILSTGGGD